MRNSCVTLATLLILGESPGAIPLGSRLDVLLRAKGNKKDLTVCESKTDLEQEMASPSHTVDPVGCPPSQRTPGGVNREKSPMEQRQPVRDHFKSPLILCTQQRQVQVTDSDVE